MALAALYMLLSNASLICFADVSLAPFNPGISCAGQETFGCHVHETAIASSGGDGACVLGSASGFAVHFKLTDFSITHQATVRFQSDCADGGIRYTRTTRTRTHRPDPAPEHARQTYCTVII